MVSISGSSPMPGSGLSRLHQLVLASRWLVEPGAERCTLALAAGYLIQDRVVQPLGRGVAFGEFTFPSDQVSLALQSPVDRRANVHLDCRAGAADDHPR